MTCDDFINSWNEQLDARTIPMAIGPLDEHAASCESCRSRAVVFRAMSRIESGPPPSSELTDRILRAWADSPSDPIILGWPRRWIQFGVLAAAASVLVAMAILFPHRPDKTPTIARTVIPVRSWTTALADATTATLALARETSAPAARIGQDVIDAGTPTELGWPLGLDGSPSGTSDMVESVTKSVNSRVKPISGSARRAFSFLITPPSHSTPGKPSEDHSGA